MPGPAPAALTVPGRLRRSVGGEAAMGGALCWTIRHLSLHPGPPLLCCLAVSDVWPCREVPERALGRGHSLPVPPALTHM